MRLGKYPIELKHKMIFKLGENNTFLVKQIFLLQKANSHLIHEDSNQDLKDNDNICIICCENPKNGILLPCKHNFVCVVCSQGLQICPMCRVRIEKILEIKL